MIFRRSDVLVRAVTPIEGILALHLDLIGSSPLTEALKSTASSPMLICLREVLAEGSLVWASEMARHANIYVTKLAEEDGFRAMGLSSAGLEHVKQLCRQVSLTESSWLALKLAEQKDPVVLAAFAEYQRSKHHTLEHHYAYGELCDTLRRSATQWRRQRSAPVAPPPSVGESLIPTMPLVWRIMFCLYLTATCSPRRKRIQYPLSSWRVR